MGHPSEYWIKSELAKEWNSDDPSFTVELANLKLKGYGLPRIADTAFSLLRAEFNPPDNFSLRSRSSLSFLRREKIATLVSPTNGTKRMVDELWRGSKLLLRSLHLLLIGGVDDTLIARKLGERFNTGSEPFTSSMIAAYRHYFWNVDACTHKEWEAHLHECKGRDAGNYIAALYAGPEQAMFRAGFSPKVDGSTLLKETQRQLYYSMQLLRFEPMDRSTINMLSTLSGRIVAVDEAMRSGGGSLQEILDKFRSIVLKRNRNTSISISELVSELEGSYSEDGKETKENGNT